MSIKNNLKIQTLITKDISKHSIKMNHFVHRKTIVAGETWYDLTNASIDSSYTDWGLPTIADIETQSNKSDKAVFFILLWGYMNWSIVLGPVFVYLYSCSRSVLFLMCNMIKINYIKWLIKNEMHLCMHKNIQIHIYLESDIYKV